MKTKPERHVEFQLEEKMGDGSWSRVYETEEEANYHDPSYKSFPTLRAAQKYANEDTRRWSAGALDRGVVRVLTITTTIARGGRR